MAADATCMVGLGKRRGLVAVQTGAVGRGLVSNPTLHPGLEVSVWSADQLSLEQRQYLAELPATATVGLGSGGEMLAFHSEERRDAMLAATGWRVIECIDLTPDYERACSRAQAADITHAKDLQALIGADEAAQRREKWARKLAAIRRRLVQRNFYLVEPI